MAFHGSGADILANGYDLGQFLQNFQQGTTVDAVDTTTFGPIGGTPTQKTYIPGLMDATMDGDGVWSVDKTGLTQDQADDILQAALRTVGGARSNVTYLPVGDGLGNPAIGLQGDEVKYEITSPVNDLVKASLSFESCVGREGMQVAHAAAAEVASGNGADLDAGAGYVPANYKGAVMYAHVLAVVGAGTINVKLQHSVDGITYVDLIANQQLAAAHTSVRAQAIGAAASVNRHLRLAWTIAGFTSVTFHAAAGRVKV
jgi:hypothetical protein